MSLYRPKVYTASKIHHNALWRLFSRQYPQLEFTARWIQLGTVPDHNTTFWTEEQKTLHWIQDIQDVQRSDFVLVYSELLDEIKGTLVEVGCAIGLGKVVLAVGLDSHHSWQAHPLVLRFPSLPEALNYIAGVS